MACWRTIASFLAKNRLPLVLLIVLVALVSAYASIGNNASTGLVCGVLAATLMTMATSLHTDVAGKLSQLLRPVLLLALLAPLVWMLLQVAPIPLDWSDPVWLSASIALNHPIAGSISIDIGATLLSIARYCAVLATAIITAALSLERQFAATMFYFLAAIPGVVAGADVAHELGYFWFARFVGGGRGSALIPAIGVIVSCSLLIRLAQQKSSRRTRAAFSSRTKVALGGPLAVLSLSTLILIIRDETNVLFVAFFGAGVPITMFVIRGWSLRTWGKLGALATAMMVLVGFFSLTPVKTDADVTQRMADLMVSDIPLLGRGAGSIGDILPVYNNIAEPFSRRGLTTAAIITVEMGRKFLWMFIFALVAGCTLLIVPSLSRGQDYVYAASGAGILLAISLMTFANDDVLNLPSSLLASAAIGFSWAQARTVGDMSSASELSRPAVSVRLLSDERPTIRLACALFGLALMAEAYWILIPEFYAGGFRPTGGVVSSVESDRLDTAASLALFRGDLWAKSALASATLPESNPVNFDHEVRQRLVNALLNAPYQANIWLTLAELADKFKWPGYNVSALLKMAYYTGPNEINLAPRRMNLALRLNATAVDIELRDFVKRDLELFLRRPELRAALIKAYRSANSEGRALADGVISWVDPTFLGAVRSQHVVAP